MADIAGVVGTFLTLATNWYHAANARNLATATFNNHYKNFMQFHEHIQGPIESLFSPDRSRRYPLSLYQAVRVLNLLIDLRAWLKDAGFRIERPGTVTGVEINPPNSYWFRRQRKGHGKLVHPCRGMTGKEVAFITLFERIRTAYERLEDTYPVEAYPSIPDPAYPKNPFMSNLGGPVRAGPGMRGGNNSELDGESEDEYLKSEGYYPPGSTSRRPEPHRHHNSDAGGSHEDDHVRSTYYVRYSAGPGDRYRQNPRHYPERAAPPTLSRATTARTSMFHVTERQEMHENRMLRNLSRRLEKEIAEMLTSKGEARKARKRKDQRRPLEEVRREILEQQEEQAESVEAQNVRDEILLAQEKLRSMRPPRPFGANIHTDGRFPSANIYTDARFATVYNDTRLPRANVYTDTRLPTGFVRVVHTDTRFPSANVYTDCTLPTANVYTDVKNPTAKVHVNSRRPVRNVHNDGAVPIVNVYNDVHNDNHNDVYNDVRADKQDDGYIFVQADSESDETAPDPERDQLEREWERLERERREVRASEKQVASDQELLRKQQKKLRDERKQFEEQERARQYAEEMRRRDQQSEYERWYQRQQSEAAQQRRGEYGRMQRAQRDDVHGASMQGEPGGSRRIRKR